MRRGVQRYAVGLLLGWALSGCARPSAEMAADGCAPAPPAARRPPARPPAAQGNAGQRISG